VRSFLILFVLLAPCPGFAEELKFATWNLDWLTTRQAGDHGLPADVTPRSDEDFARLAGYVQELDADVVAIQEVDGFAAATKIFPRERYSVHMTRDHVLQRVGIVVRRGLKYDMNPDVTGLAINHLRSGADITLHLGSSDLRVLAVHLKTGCRKQKLVNAHDRSCRELADQVPVLAEWITARQQEGTAFVILGDFNRWMDGRDPLLGELRRSAPLVRATEGHSSPCWGAENFIDHILAGGAATNWMQPDTLRVLTYRETDPSVKDRLSDHCPVSVRFNVPD
jgi:endonuclease/exonuclease/phosphatase family metal-dependent hydrolase